jgi:hypothetical protein
VTAQRAALSALVFGALFALTAVHGLAGAGEDAAASPPPPLTNEDVVRMVAAGTPEPEIVEAIRSRREEFDLSDEMVSELSLAGVPAAIVTAMRQRHAELAPAPPPRPPSTRGLTPIVVSINPGASGPRAIRAPKWADEDAKQRFQLPKETDQREVKDLAVFLACTSSDHVPDLWRSKSPLGRDMSFVMRHEMLAFVAGDTPTGKTPRLELPARLEGELDDSEPHDLVLGVAARVGDRWIQLAAGRLAKVTIAPGGKPLVGRIGHRGGGFDFTAELKAEP